MVDGPHSKIKLAVIGGGVSGLAAAHRLHQLLPHAEVALFEAGPRLGGPLHTLCSGGMVLEQGADSFLTRDPVVVDLCRDLGIADELIPISREHRRALVVRRGKLVPVPAGFALMRPGRLAPMLRSPLFSLRGKLRLLGEPLVRAPADADRTDHDESVASFATRRLGREVFERLVEPLMAGIYVADADRLSLAATMPEFLEAERTSGSIRRGAHESEDSNDQTSGARYGAFFTLRDGLGRLIAALAGALPGGAIHLSTPIAELHRTADRWTIAPHPACGLAPAVFDGVILATPAPASAALIKSFDPTLAAQLSAIEYAGSVVVTLVYRRSQIAHPLDAFGLVVPRIERRQLIAASFPSVKFPGRGPADVAPIRVFLGGALHPEAITLSDDELLAIARRELEELLGASGEPLESHVARWPASMPQYHVGHVARIDAIESRVATHAGLAIAGNAYRGVGIPQCVKSGRAAAERLAEAYQPT